MTEYKAFLLPLVDLDQQRLGKKVSKTFSQTDLSFNSYSGFPRLLTCKERVGSYENIEIINHIIASITEGTQSTGNGRFVKHNFRATVDMFRTGGSSALNAPILQVNATFLVTDISAGASLITDRKDALDFCTSWTIYTSSTDGDTSYNLMSSFRDLLPTIPNVTVL